MKQECTAIGMATSTLIHGACEKEAPMDLAVKLMEAAIEDAQKKASQICKEGCICKGKGTPIDIVCYSVTGVDGQKYHQWRVTAAWDGECKCPGEAKEQEPPFEFIEAKFDQLQEFFERLPETPIGKKCQLVKKREGAHTYTLICKGSCQKGKCPAYPQWKVDFEKGVVRFECKCQ